MKLPVAEIVVAAVVAAAGIGVYAWAHRHEPAIERTKERGDVIVAALQSYRLDAGRYPDSLSAMVPTLLDSIPAPVWGDDWTYRTFDGGVHAELYVRATGGRLTLRYDFPGRRWALDN